MVSFTLICRTVGSLGARVTVVILVPVARCARARTMIPARPIIFML